MTDIARAEEAAPEKELHLGWALVLISIAQLMVVLDGTITNIALPYIGQDLDINQANLSWIVTGYALAFGAVAVLQAVVAVVLTVGLLGMDVRGPIWVLAVVAVLDAILGSALGLLVSAFAATEFQAVQFMPAFVLPQVLLCGLFVPRESLPDVLSVVSDVLPLSYAVDAMREVQTESSWTSGLSVDVGVIAGSGLVALALASATLRRRTA